LLSNYCILQATPHFAHQPESFALQALNYQGGFLDIPIEIAPDKLFWRMVVALECLMIAIDLLSRACKSIDTTNNGLHTDLKRNRAENIFSTNN
jgi:hypothetical protein